MESTLNNEPPQAVVAYTSYPWEHAISVMRIVGPLQRAGLKLIRGNVTDDIHPERVSLGDVVLIQREFPGYYQHYEQIVASARSEGKPIIYEIDDLLLDLPEEHPDRAIHYYTKSLFPMLEAILVADAVTASNPDLCEYLRSLNPNTWLLPNYLEDALWPLEESPKNPVDPPVIVGYMGSDTHLPDLELVSPVLLRLIERFGESISLKFWGGQPPETIRINPRVEWIPLEMKNYAEFVSFFSHQHCDIFIAPLVDSQFNRCKSPIKYLEYSSRGIPGVYSRVTPFESVVHHGENGFLATTLAEWEDGLVRLIEDPELRLKLGMRALDTVKREWLLSQHAHQWPEVYTQALSSSNAERSRKLGYTEVMIKALKQLYAWQREIDPDLHPALIEKEQEIAWLRAELNNIYNSSSWAFIQKMQSIRRFFIPEGSKREQALISVLQKLRQQRLV